MQFSYALFASCLLGSVMADFTVKEVDPHSPNSGSSSRRAAASLFKRQGAAPCTDNGQCRGGKPYDQCFIGTGDDECLEGGCYTVVRDVQKLCGCKFGSEGLSDACARGHPDTLQYKFYCVYDCQPDGSSGNGGCNATQDPCKAA